MIRIRIHWRKLRIMTRNFQIGAQLLALVAQYMMDPAASYFRWTPELAKLLHASLAAGQAALGILAHSYNADGTKSA